MKIVNFIFVGVLISASACGAQPRRREQRVNAHERRDNRRDIREDRRHLEQILTIREQWLAALASGNHSQEVRADNALQTWLAKEIREADREVRENKRESRRSRRELGNSRRHRRAAPSPRARHAHRDDRRDLRDDKRDLSQARRMRAQMATVARQIQQLQPAFDTRSATQTQYERKRSLLTDLVRLSKAQLQQEKTERREDRRETREDRRRL